jgi:alkylhydroperoxidase family enzyme
MWGGDFDDAINSFAAAVMRATSLDPVITELVRLRCAQYHDCRLCGSLRLHEAVEQGVDEAIVAKIAHYESSDLSEAAKAALRLADAMISRPATADDKLRAELREHFTESQIAEICLDVVKWSQQKYLVALRVETPPWTGLGSLSFDEDGNPQVGV